jgi:hypothetical protein
MTAASLLSRLVLAGVVVFGLAGSALAQPALSNPNPNANSIALARELLTLKGGPEMFDGMVSNVVTRTKDQFIPTNPSLAKPLNEIGAQLLKEFEGKRNEVFNEVARAYARHFTEAELRELLAFYKTTLGRKVLSTESYAVEDGFKRAQEWSATFAEQVLARLRAEMKKRGHDI